MAQCYYTENYQTWSPSGKQVWEEKDLSPWLPSTGDITAEIVILNSNTIVGVFSGGIRAAGSSLDRKFNIYRVPFYDGYNPLTLHVQVSGGKIECYASSGIDFCLLGYWTGTRYVEKNDDFAPASGGAWINTNLSTFGVPSGAIAEIALGDANGNNNFGVRSVGNDNLRYVKMNAGDTLHGKYNYWTSLVQTSGNNATIQYYSQTYTTGRKLFVCGYWDTPPGDYTDIFDRDAANPINDSTWDVIDVANVQSGYVASFGIMTEEPLHSRVLGIRQSGSIIDRKNNIRFSTATKINMVYCSHVNVNPYIEAYSEDASGSNDDFTLLGYWNNFSSYFESINASGNLYICGHDIAPVLSGSKLYYTNLVEKQIVAYDIDNFETDIIVASGLNAPYGIVSDSIRDHLYWVDKSDGTVNRCTTSGDNICIISSGFSLPSHIAFDYLNSNLYIVGNSDDYISRINIDGSNNVLILDSSDGISAPSRIQLLPYSGIMFWTETDTTNGKIKKANLDGSEIQTIVSGLYNPIGIALDKTNNKIYWTHTPTTGDPFNGQIQRSNFDGSNIETISDGFGFLLGLVIDQFSEFAYVNIYAGAENDVIAKVNMSDGTKEYIIMVDGHINGMAIYNPSPGIKTFTHGHDTILSSSDLFISGKDDNLNNCNLFIPGHDIVSISSDLFIDGECPCNDSCDLFTSAMHICSNNLNLFVKTWNFDGNCHYTEDIHSWHIENSGSWEVHDLNSHIVVPSGDTPSIVAEILISNIGDIPWSGGVRTLNSSLDRKIGIFQQDNIEWSGANYGATMHVQLSNDHKLECYAQNCDDIKFILLGYWVGPEYVELAERFNFVGAADWAQKSLDTYGVASGAIAELVAGCYYSSEYRMGARQIGSDIDRFIYAGRGQWTGLPGSSRGYWSTFVNTSGNNAVIEIKSDFPTLVTGGIYWMENFVAGYWSNPPGEYTEQYTIDDASIGIDSTWTNVSGTAPSDSVAQYYVSNKKLTKQTLGIRSLANELDRKFSLPRSPTSKTSNFSSHVNVSSDVKVYAQYGADNNENINLLGYWNNFNSWTPLTSDSISLFMSGIPAFINTSGDKGGLYPSGVSLYIYGIQSDNIDLFTNGADSSDASGSLFIHGIFNYATSQEYSLSYPSGLQCYTVGSGIISESGQFPLVIDGFNIPEVSGDLFINGYDLSSVSGDLFIKAPEPAASSLSLFIYNPVDLGPGLIREADAVFYLRYYHDGPDSAGDIQEFVNNQTWYIPETLFQHSPFIGVSGKVVENVGSSEIIEPFAPTFGDGTYPQFNDLGGPNYREALDTDYRTPGGGWQSTKLGYSESTKYQQNTCGPIDDYQYPGSSSFTTVFWMSGAHTSGNVAEVGWFRKDNVEDLDIALAVHTVGIRIESESGLTVITNMRDVPYEQPSGGGLWWGGTTHYGTPTGTDWTWRSANEYWTWTEEWPTVHIEHNPITFVALHADFIASGVDGGHPNHMKVYLSLDGQPWTYIGSGLTGPPASSLYSYSDPRNRKAENCVGVRQQGINVSGGIIPAEIGGVKQGSIILSENVLWTDADKFTNGELSALYSVVDQYYRPLNEYRPTIVPPSTYIKRTFSDFIYSPADISVGYNPGEICSGILVTIEVGLGAYGDAASAYLIEENIPSGVYVRNISRSSGTSAYYNQGSRPAGGQAAFNDPQSGIILPYDFDVGNIYESQIRWINHDNNPEPNQRRSPQPIKTFTYELYPQHYSALPYVDIFEFNGSGIFFGGSIGSGTFDLETINDKILITSGLTGGIIQNGCSLYVSGPIVSSGTINLYIRTQETFTSAYIGTAQKTPTITDFIFAADGAAAIESMPGMEYGPPLYTRGPIQYTNTCDFVIFGPEANNVDFFIHGYAHIDTSGNYPSGLSLHIGNGHESSVASGNLFINGPVLSSGNMYMHTRAGAFEPPIDLLTIGHILYSGDISGYIKGPEFICSSGNFSYPGNQDDFIYPYGNPSPTLYILPHTNASGTCPLYIGPQRLRENWILYLKTDSNSKNNTLNLFVHGFTSVSGVNQTFNNASLYIEAIDADYPYTGGGTEKWTLFLDAQEGNPTSDEAWSLFLKADLTIPASYDMYIRGHASGQAPNGIEITDFIGLVCSVNPDDPRRIGFIPHNSDNDPWTLFLKCVPGHFGITTLYMSGAAPTLLASSGNLFVEGLFEQETAALQLYLMGISGIFNNGPSGLYLFIDAGRQVYNTSGNMYTHGY
jgi:hypothetical protein